MKQIHQISRFGIVLAVATAIVAAAIILSQWIPVRDVVRACQLNESPRLDSVEVIFEGGSGSWGWWPTGLTCVFPTTSGTDLIVAPSPWLTVVLVVGLAGGAVAVLFTTVLFALRRR